MEMASASIIFMKIIKKKRINAMKKKGVKHQNVIFAILFPFGFYSSHLMAVNCIFIANQSSQYISK